MSAEPTQWDDPRHVARDLRRNAASLLDSAYGDASMQSVWQRDTACRQAGFADFVESFPAGTAVAGGWHSPRGFRFRVPAPVMQSVCNECETVHVSIDCPVCFPGVFASAVDKLFGFHRPLPFVAALMAGLALAGGAVGQQASSATYVPPSSFQVQEIGDRSEAVGWPHRFTAVEARGMSREVSRVFRREYRPFTTYPSHKRAVAAKCSTSGRAFSCRLVDRKGRGVVFVGVDRVWEDGSVRVVWPQAPRIALTD